MKFAILGATGGTGLCLVRQALLMPLDEGHEVIAIVRNTAKLSDIQHEKFKAVEGNVFSAESIQPHLKGCDAVFSCLGSNSMFSATTIYSAPMKAIATAMRGAQVKRLLVVSSWHVKVDPNDKPGFIIRWIMRPMAYKPLRDVAAMENFLQDECQDLDFTVIRPGWLTDDPKSEGKELVVDVGRQFCDSSDKISRADVADFMIKNVETERYFKKDLAIGLKA